MKQEMRILNILSKLSTHKVVSISQLTDEFNIAQRTIQRDMKILKEFIGNSLISPQRGSYQLLDTHFFSDILNDSNKVEDLSEFFEFITLFDSDTLSFLEDEKFTFLKKIKKDSSQIYTIFDSPIEKLKKIKFLEDIKHSIINRQYCDIIYNELEPRVLTDVEPQKIIYAKNNWYLAITSKHYYKKNGGFKRLRINFIDEFKLKSKTFHSDQQAQEHIKDMQSLFQDYQERNYEVIVEVDHSVSRHFLVKDFLSSQELIETKENGNLMLSFKINNDMEIIPLIKTWLPHLKVISPKSLDEKIRSDISLY